MRILFQACKKLSDEWQDDQSTGSSNIWYSACEDAQGEVGAHSRDDTLEELAGRKSAGDIDPSMRKYIQEVSKSSA